MVGKEPGQPEGDRAVPFIKNNLYQRFSGFRSLNCGKAVS